MTLGSHQRTVGRSDVRFTPPRIFRPLGPFDTDAAAGDPRPWSIGRHRNITAADDALAMDWTGFGRTWLNPPFNRYRIEPFIRRMAAHDHGVLLVHARTETAWFRIVWEAASALLFLAGRVIFLDHAGQPTRTTKGQVANSGAPVVLASFGPADMDVLAAQPPGFGAFVALRLPRAVVVAAIEPTWIDAVAGVLAAASGPVALADLYRALAAHPKARGRRHWRAKLRQTLQRGPFRRVGRGIWETAG